MNTKDLNKIRQKFSFEMKDLINEGARLNWEINILKKKKKIFSFKYACVGSFILPLLLFFALKGLGIITSISNIYIFSLITVPSLLTWAYCKKLAKDIRKADKTFSEITDVKTEKEIEEEIVKRKIKYSNIRNRCVINNMAYVRCLEERIPTDQDNEKTNITNEDVEKFEKKVNAKERALNDRYKNFDILSTRKTLYEEFMFDRNTFGNLLYKSFKTGTVISLYTLLLVIALGGISQIPIQLLCFTSFAVSGIYSFKKILDKEDIFNKFNEQLGDKCLTGEEDLSTLSFDNLNTMSLISNLSLDLEMNKLKLEQMKKEISKQDKIENTMSLQKTITYDSLTSDKKEDAIKTKIKIKYRKK